MEFTIPKREELSEANQQIYDNVKAQLGFMPNLYTYMAKHPNALADYLSFLNRESTLTQKEKELVSLVVSEHNSCVYCLSAHTTLGKMSGFSEGEIIAIRSRNESDNDKLNALLNITVSLIENNGKADATSIANFFNAGYSENNLLDVVFVIADKYITNFIARTSSIDIDFPVAESLNSEVVS